MCSDQTIELFLDERGGGEVLEIQEAHDATAPGRGPERRCYFSQNKTCKSGRCFQCMQTVMSVAKRPWVVARGLTLIGWTGSDVHAIPCEPHCPTFPVFVCRIGDGFLHEIYPQGLV